MSHVNGRRVPVKTLSAILVAAFSLSACIVAVDADDDDDDWRYAKRNGYKSELSVRLVDGDRARITCPKDYESFVEEADDGATRYGCEYVGDGDGR